ncbi:hypothetical protein PLEOSDRAFT_162819 [Pleurotus ostreatus PC15]|uniref:Uncharacterized protein n=1 Tax=Pleurotus ostreatus (strain PC15) TaxID=1137138 RepID=A0A067N542_PLEO1|nr:hypothetical protein PLEOSDRAFT_162819 [Pleurotus ostreatus PC15]
MADNDKPVACEVEPTGPLSITIDGVESYHNPILFHSPQDPASEIAAPNRAPFHFIAEEMVCNYDIQPSE